MSIFAYAKIVLSVECLVLRRYRVAIGDDCKRGVAKQRNPKLFTFYFSLFTLFLSGASR